MRRRPQPVSYRYTIIILILILAAIAALILLPTPASSPPARPSSSGRLPLQPGAIGNLYQLLPSRQSGQLQPTPTGLQPAAGRDVYEQFETPQPTGQPPQ